jgi:16S rRNA (cytidine1402-2'-O)-methyltransferase
VFAGFLPTGAQQRERSLRALAADNKAFMLFEAPHRIADLIGLLAAVLAPERRVVLARELSKKFETVSVHTASQLAELSLEERGEYVVLVDVAATNNADEIDPSVVHWLRVLLDDMPPSRAAAIAAKASGHSKPALYALALKLKAA